MARIGRRRHRFWTAGIAYCVILCAQVAAQPANPEFPIRFFWPSPDATANFGLFTDFHPSRIPETGLQEALNVTLTPQGTLRKRYGCSLFEVTPNLTEYPILGRMFTDAASGIVRLILCTPSGIWEAGTIGIRYSWPVGGKFHASMAELDGTIVAVNGIDKPAWSKDGQEWQVLGLAPWNILAVTAENAAPGTRGQLAPGMYKYVITRGNKFGHESGAFPSPLQARTAIISATQRIAVRMPTENISSNNTVRLYRTEANGVQLYFLKEFKSVSDYDADVADLISDGTKDTWYDDGLSAALSSAPLDEIDANEPPSGLKHVCAYSERIFGATGRSLYFSNILNPQNWNKYNTWVPPDAIGDITALYTFQGAMLVFTAHNIWALTGSDPLGDDAFHFFSIANGIGTRSPQSIRQVGPRLFFMSSTGQIQWLERTGEYTFSGAAVGMLPISWQVRDLFANQTDSTKPYATAGVLDDKYMIAFTPRNGSSNTSWFVAFVNQPFLGYNNTPSIPWTQYQIAHGGAAAGIATFIEYADSSQGNVLLASLARTTPTLIRIENPTYTRDAWDGEDGIAIPQCKIRSKQFDFGDFATYKQHLEAQVRLKNEANTRVSLFYDKDAEEVPLLFSSLYDPRSIIDGRCDDIVQGGKNVVADNDANLEDCELVVAYPINEIARVHRLPMRALGRVFEIAINDSGTDSALEFIGISIDYRLLERRPSWQNR